MKTIYRDTSGKYEINNSLLFSDLGNHSEQFLLGLIFYEGEKMEENLKAREIVIKHKEDKIYQLTKKQPH